MVAAVAFLNPSLSIKIKVCLDNMSSYTNVYGSSDSVRLSQWSLFLDRLESHENNKERTFE